MRARNLSDINLGGKISASRMIFSLLGKVCYKGKQSMPDMRI